MEDFTEAAQDVYRTNLATATGAHPANISLAMSPSSIRVIATIRMASLATAQAAAVNVNEAIVTVPASGQFMGFAASTAPVSTPWHVQLRKKITVFSIF